MKQLRLALVGFGVVGRGFAELLTTKHTYLKQRYGVDVTYKEPFFCKLSRHNTLGKRVGGTASYKRRYIGGGNAHEFA